MKIKKWILFLGGITTVVLPLISVVSCGNNVSGGVSWSYKTKTVIFNLDQSTTSNNPFSAYAPNGEISVKNFIKLNTDFNNAVAKNNGTKLINGDIINLRMTGWIFYKSTNPKILNKSIINYVLPIKYSYNSKSSVYGKWKDVTLKSNFLDMLLKGLASNVSAKTPGSSLLETRITLSDFLNHPNSTHSILIHDNKNNKVATFVTIVKAIWRKGHIHYNDDITTRSVTFDTIDLTK